MPRHRLILALGLLALSGCARRALPGRPLDPVELARAPAAAPGGPGEALSFEQALERAVCDGPELRALRLSVEAAGAWPAREPLEVSAGADSDGRPEGGLTLDLLSLLGQGPLRAERVLARLRRSEAAVALTARTREVAGELAEAYAVDEALRVEPAVPALLDPAAFVRAGLATEAATVASDAAAASLAAEAASRESERRAAALTVGRLVGRLPAQVPALAPAPAPWPPVPEPEAARLLQTNPEVQRRVAAHETARGEALRALVGRDPSLILEPSIALDPTQLFGALRLRIPVGADGPIRAAYARMRAAEAEVEAAVHAALAQAATARSTWSAAQVVAHAAERRLAAALALANSERARVEAQGEGFTEAVLASNAVVDALASLREARVEEARARVKAAVAAGWPSPR